MKKTIRNQFTKCILLCSTCFFLYACSKNNEQFATPVPQNENISTISEMIILDESFISFTKTYIEESYKIKANKNDTSILMNASENIQKALANFLINAPGFLAQSTSERKEVLENIRVLLTNENFRAKHSNEFKQFSSFNRSSISSTIAVSGYTTMVSELESNEIVNCAIEAIINMLGSYGGTIDKVMKLRGLNFSTSELIKLAFDIVKKDSPWYVVASLSLQVGTCLISELND